MDGNTEKKAKDLVSHIRVRDRLENKPTEIKPLNDEQIQNVEIESNIDNANKIIGSFVTNLYQDTKLRSNYACYLLWILGIQIAILNVFIFCWGFEGIKFSLKDSVFHWFLTLVVSEIIGFVYIVANYLFKPNDKLLEQMIKLLKNKE